MADSKSCISNLWVPLVDDFPLPLLCREASKFHNKISQYHINLITVTTRAKYYKKNSRHPVHNITWRISSDITTLLLHNNSVSTGMGPVSDSFMAVWYKIMETNLNKAAKNKAYSMLSSFWLIPIFSQKTFLRHFSLVISFFIKEGYSYKLMCLLTSWEENKNNPQFVVQVNTRSWACSLQLYVTNQIITEHEIFDCNRLIQKLKFQSVLMQLFVKKEK